jgi:acyl dehydratase
VTTFFHTADELRAAVGKHLGYSDWLEMTQERVNLFADATGDHQWIHVDVDRAKVGPYGGPIAHGYLTLALTNLFNQQLVDVPGATAGINYGTDKVRFPAPVLVGSRIRMGSQITEVTDVPGGVQAKIVHTVEVEGGTKPACVVESLNRYLFD